MKITFKNTFSVLVLLIILFVPNFLFAAESGPTPDPRESGPTSQTITLQNPFRYDGDLFAFIKTLINDIVLPLGGMLAVLAFIYSGFLYVTAQGNDAKIKTAHKALLYSAIGTAILLGAWAIANAIEATINQL